MADLMDTEPVWVPGDTTVLQAQDEFFLRYRWPWFPVADPISGRFLGLLHQARGRRRRGRRASRRCTSPTWSTRTATRPSACTTTPRSSSSWLRGPALASAR